MRQNPTPNANLRNSTGSSDPGSTTMSARHEPQKSSRELGTLEHAYTPVNGRPPAQANIQRFFQVTPPSVHQMLLTLERERLISRRPGMPRNIAVLVDRADLPALEPGYG